ELRDVVREVAGDVHVACRVGIGVADPLEVATAAVGELPAVGIRHDRRQLDPATTGDVDATNLLPASVRDVQDVPVDGDAQLVVDEIAGRAAVRVQPRAARRQFDDARVPRVRHVDVVGRVDRDVARVVELVR